MSSLNKVILVGHLGKDVEVRHAPEGGKIANFPLATSDVWTDKQSGEKKTKTEWHKIAIFNERLVDVCEKYLKKGSKVYVEGQLQTRKWTNKEGKEIYTTEIVLSKFKGEIVLLDAALKSQAASPELQPLTSLQNSMYGDVPF